MAAADRVENRLLALAQSVIRTTCHASAVPADEAERAAKHREVVAFPARFARREGASTRAAGRAASGRGAGSCPQWPRVVTRMSRAGRNERTYLVATQTTASPGTIGADLERRRLEHRAQRIEFALAALRRLADARTVHGPVPPPLRQAMAGFSQELAQVQRRLANL
jgi:hypothetical protein